MVSIITRIRIHSAAIGHDIPRLIQRVESSWMAKTQLEKSAHADRPQHEAKPNKSYIQTRRTDCHRIKIKTLSKDKQTECETWQIMLQSKLFQAIVLFVIEFEQELNIDNSF